MPDCSSVDQNENDGKHAANIITVVSKFAEDHPSLLRNMSTGLAVAGVIVISRSIRLVTKFSSPSEIPAHFIERNVSIRGRVRSVTEKGLEVEHVPIYIPFLSPLLTNRHVMTPLRVCLAGVDLTPQGHDWLAHKLKTEETVWLRLISRQDDCLQCLVSLSRGSLFNICLNEEILRLGFGRTAPLHGLDPHSPIYLRIHRRLLKCEGRAERNRQGLWKEETLRDRVIGVIKNNTVITAIKRVIKWISR